MTNLAALTIEHKYAEINFAKVIDRFAEVKGLKTKLALLSMLLRLIHVVAYNNSTSFVLLNNTPLFGYTTFCFSIHYLIDIWIVHSLGPYE